MPSVLIHEIFADIPECADYIALSKVFAQLVAVECDLDPFDQDELRNELAAPSPTQEVLRWFTRRFQAGQLGAVGRPIGGGPLKPIPRDHWYADKMADRFVSSRYCRSKPFDPDAPHDTWIFIPEGDFEALWRGVQERVLGESRPAMRRRPVPSREETSPVRSESQLLGVRSVEVIVGLGRSSIYKLMKCEAFPAQVKIGGRALWRREDVEGWVAQIGGQQE